MSIVIQQESHTLPKKSQWCYYSDRRTALSFPDDFSNFFPACILLLNYYARGFIFSY